MLRSVVLLIDTRCIALIAAVVYRLALEISYVLFVNPIYEYAGFSVDIEVFKYVESWVLYVFLISVFPKNVSTPSALFMNILLLLYLVPILVLYGLADQSREHLYIILMGAIIVNVARKGRPVTFLAIREGKVAALLVLCIGVAVVTTWMIVRGGLDFFSLDFSRVYDFRGVSGETLNVGFMAHLNVWATKVFGPALLAIALWKKNYWLAVGLFLMHVLWFGITTHKSVIFYPILVAAVYFVVSKFRYNTIISIGLASVAVFSLLSFYVVMDLWVGSLLVRRALFVPALNSFIYYDFFSRNDLVFWSNSIMSSFIQYPYDNNPAVLIGKYTGRDGHVNNSFMATGYMHAGVYGVVFYCIVVGLIFRVVDSLCHRGVPASVAASVLIVPIYSLLLAADLPTAMLTHGVGMAMVILFLIRSSRETFLPIRIRTDALKHEPRTRDHIS